MTLTKHHPIFSPSSFPMLAECPCFERSHDEAAILLEPSEKTTTYRDRGTLLHEVFASELAAVESPDKGYLTPHELEGIEWAVDYVLAHITKGWPVEIEQQVVLLDDGFHIVTFGTADVLNGPQVFDLKTGDYHNYWLQIAVYALAQMDRIGIDETEVKVLFSRFKKAHELRISREEARGRIFAVVEKVIDPTKKPRANPYCRWCRKISKCPAVVHLASGERIKNYKYDEPNELAHALFRARLLKDWAAQIEQDAKKMALAGIELPGFELKSRQGAREIVDVKRAHELSGLPPDEFLALCNLPVGALEDLIAEREKIGKTAAKRQINLALSEVIRRRAPTIHLQSTQQTEPTEPNLEP